jgi:hypothetical protein
MGSMCWQAAEHRVTEEFPASSSIYFPKRYKRALGQDSPGERGSIMTFFILFVYIAVTALGEFWLGKILKLNKHKNPSYRLDKALNWIETILLLIFIAIMSFTQSFQFHLFLYFGILVIGFRTILELLFSKNKKQYLLSLYSLATYVIFIIICSSLGFL